MSVKETNQIDGMGVDEENNTLVFLIVDPYTWIIEEYDHLKTLQTKINNYVGYIQSGGYKSAYGDRTFDRFCIEIAFQYQFTENAERFLNAGRRQLKEHGIDIRYHVQSDGE